LYYLVRSDGTSSRELAAQLLTIAEKQGDAEYVLEAHSGNGALAFWEGKFTECHEHLLRARVLYDASKHAHHQFVYGQDPLAYGYSYGALALWFLGYPDQAKKSAEKAIELAQRTNHPLTLAGVLSFAGDLHHHLGNREQFAELAEKTLAVAVDQGLPMWVGNALTMRGWANFDPANPDVALRDIQAGLDAFHATGAELNTVFLSTRLVEAHLAAGRYDQGIARAEALLQLLETHFERYYESELVRLKGELHWRSGKGAPEAEACFRRALAVAREQGAKSLELRAAMSLGKLERERGNTAEGVRLLSEVYGWFTEGLDTPDLVAAKKLLGDWQTSAL
jgi:tetratricopeptide (TPR) repeat protein